MANEYFLTIDRGQTSIKAAIMNMNGEELFVSSCKCEPLQIPHPGWAQQDMELIWSQAADVIRHVIADNGIDASDIKALSFSGQGGGNFLIDDQGEPVYPGVVSMDSRHESVMKEFDNPEGVDIPRTAAFMLWLKKNEPEVYKRTRWILGSKDWIRYCLTGKANADLSDTVVPADPVTREYDRNIWLFGRTCG